MIYYVIFFGLLMFSFLEIVLKIKKNNFLYGLFSLFLIFFAGTRWLVGTDFSHYQNLFELINSSAPYSDGIELSFKIISQLVSDFPIILLLYAFPAILLKLLLIRKAKYPFSSLMLYFSFTYLSYDMGRMRQGLALAICMFSIFYIQKHKLFKFLICMVLAFCFHKPAVIFIIMYPISKLKFSRNFMLTTALISLVFAFLHVDIYIANIILKSNLLSQYAGYLTIDSQYYQFYFSLTNLRRIVLLFLFCTLIESKDFMTKFYVKAFYIGTIIFYLFRDFSIISERLAFYFCCFDIFLIPLCIYNKKSVTKFFGFILMSVYGFYYLYTTLALDPNIDEFFNKPYIPYQTSILFLSDYSIITFLTIIFVIAIFLLIYNYKKIKFYLNSNTNLIYAKNDC